MAVDAGTVSGTLEFDDKATPVVANAADAILQRLEALDAELAAVGKSSEDSGAKLTQMGGMAEGVAGAFFEAGKAIFGAVQDIAAMVSKSAEAAEVISNLALTTGMGVEEIQELQLAAKVAGVSMGSLESAFLRLQRAIGSNSKALVKWGFDARELAAKPASEAFKEVVARIDELGSHTSQVAAITDLFGRGAVKSLLPLIDTMKNLGDESSRFSTSMTQEQISALAAVDDATDQLSISVERLQNQWSAAIAQNPLIVQGMETIKDALDTLTEKTKEVDWKQFWEEFIIVGMAASLTFRGIVQNMVQTAALFSRKGNAPTIAPTALVEPDTGAMGDAADVMEREIKLLEGVGEEAKKAAKEVRDLAKAHKEWEQSLSAAEKEMTKLSALGEEAGLREWAADMKDLDHLSKQLTESSRAQEEQILALADAYAKWAKEQDKLELDDAARLLEEEAHALEALRQASIQMFADIGNLGAAIDDLGNALGSSLVAGLGEAITGFGDFAAAMKSAEGDMQRATVAISALSSAYSGASTSTAKSALSGAAKGAGAGAMFGPVGAIIGGALGAIAGIFGSSKKKAEELKKKQDEAMKAFGDMFDDWKNARKELAAVGAEGINALVSSMVDEEGNLRETFTTVANAAEYTAATFAMLRASGLSVADALTAIAPALDALGAADPEALAGTAAEPLVQLANFAAANEQLLNFTMGLGLTAQALAGFGLFTQEMATKMSLDMNNAIAQMVAGGLTEAQASALVAQDLYNLKMAAEQSGVTLDAHTQKLIADAEAAGLFENLEDPMKRLVEVQEAMLAATGELIKLFGGQVPAAVQKMIDEFNSAKINVNVNVNVGEGGGGGEDQGRDFQHGSGGVQDFGSGTLATLHGREGVFTEDQVDMMTTPQDTGQLSGLIMNLPSMLTRAMREANALSVN